MSEEQQLREKIGCGSQNPDDYEALAKLLYESARLDESVGVLRQALRLPLSDPSRAALLTKLGRCLNNLTDDIEEPLSLGEQAIALTQGTETIEALTVRAFAQSLVSQCVSDTDSVRATEAATSALSLLVQVLDGSATLDDQFAIHLEAANLNRLLGRAEEAAERCKQALQLAANQDQRVICMTELGDIYRRAGRPAEARETLARISHEPPSKKPPTLA